MDMTQPQTLEHQSIQALDQLCRSGGRGEREGEGERERERERESELFTVDSCSHEHQVYKTLANQFPVSKPSSISSVYTNNHAYDD